MATSIPSYITVIFSLKDGQNIRAQVPTHFEPTDFIKIVQEKLGPAAVSEFYFSLNGEELLLDDLDAFKTQKDFITDNCTIVVNKSSGKHDIYELSIEIHITKSQYSLR